MPSGQRQRAQMRSVVFWSLRSRVYDQVVTSHLQADVGQASGGHVIPGWSPVSDPVNTLMVRWSAYPDPVTPLISGGHQESLLTLGR